MHQLKGQDACDFVDDTCIGQWSVCQRAFNTQVSYRRKPSLTQPLKAHKVPVMSGSGLGLCRLSQHSRTHIKKYIQHFQDDHRMTPSI